MVACLLNIIVYLEGIKKNFWSPKTGEQRSYKDIRDEINSK